MAENPSQPWFDLDTGALLIGEEAIQRRFEEGAVNIQPLAELVLDKTFDPRTYGYERADVVTWSAEDAHNYGEWIVGALSDYEEYKGLSMGHIQQLGRLGIGPHIKTLLQITGAGSFAKYKKLVESRAIKIEGKPSTWSQDDFRRYALKVDALIEGRPTRKDYQAYHEKDPENWPSTSMIQRRVGGIDALNELIGHAPLKWSHHKWALEDYIKHAKRVARSVGRAPTYEDYRTFAAKSPQRYPSDKMIGNRITIGRLHEYIGYPDVKSWDPEDYIDWGVRIMRSNGGLIVTPRIMNALCRKQRSPSDFSIRAHFNSWSAYKAQVLQQYEEELIAQQTKLHTYRQQITDGELPEAAADFDDQALLRVGSGAALFRYLLPGTELPALYRLETGGQLITAITDQQPKLSPGDIETLALANGLFDDIWPVKDLHAKALELDDSELAELFGSRSPRYFDNDLHVLGVASPAALNGVPSVELLGRLIQQKRMLAGFTREGLAQRAHISKNYLSNIERANIVTKDPHSTYVRPSKGVLHAIATHLELDIDQLLTLAGHAA